MSINASYLNQLGAFTSFANMAISVGSRTAVAYVAKSGGAIREISQNCTDKRYAFFRSNENKALNNEVRALFRNTIANLFGSEKDIPDSVKNAMCLKDYDKGRPLTAKRINEVRIAIMDYLDSNPYGSTIDRGDLVAVLNGDAELVDESADKVDHSINSVDDSIVDDEIKSQPKIDVEPKVSEPKTSAKDKSVVTQIKNKVAEHKRNGGGIMNTDAYRNILNQFNQGKKGVYMPVGYTKDMVHKIMNGGANTQKKEVTEIKYSKGVSFVGFKGNNKKRKIAFKPFEG